MHAVLRTVPTIRYCVRVPDISSHGPAKSMLFVVTRFGYLHIIEKNAKIRETGIPNNSRISVLAFIYLIWYIGLDL